MIKNIFRLSTCALALASPLSYAAQLSPVRLLVQPSQRSASLQIQNDSDAEAVYDIRVKSWVSMDETGKDTLEDTDAIISSRPVVTIPANESATIRFVVTNRSGKVQDNYRVLVTDITSPKTPNSAVVRVQSVLPMFVSTNLQSKGKLELIDGKVVNTGDRHVRITGYKEKTGKEVKTLRYVLPGQSMTLPVQSVADITTNETIN